MLRYIGILVLIQTTPNPDERSPLDETSKDGSRDSQPSQVSRTYHSPFLREG